MESIDEGQRIRLKTQLTAHDSDRASRCGVHAGGFRKQPTCYHSNGAIGDTVPAFHMQAKEVRVQLFLMSNVVAHEDRSDLPAEESHNVKERGKCQNPLRLG